MTSCTMYYGQCAAHKKQAASMRHCEAGNHFIMINYRLLYLTNDKSMIDVFDQWQFNHRSIIN